MGPPPPTSEQLLAVRRQAQDARTEAMCGIFGMLAGNLAYNGAAFLSADGFDPAFIRIAGFVLMTLAWWVLIAPYLIGSGGRRASRALSATQGWQSWPDRPKRLAARVRGQAGQALMLCFIGILLLVRIFSHPLFVHPAG